MLPTHGTAGSCQRPVVSPCMLQCPRPTPLRAGRRQDRRGPPRPLAAPQQEASTSFPTGRLGGSLGSLDSIASSVDYELFESKPCKFGGVLECMRQADRGLLTANPDETLEDIIPRLSKVTGLPVLNPSSGLVLGVISRRDIIRVRKRKGSLQAKVGDHMTAPAVTINVAATVEEAAALMLEKKIRRLPVVDDEGYPVGILAKSDIFKPLFEEQYTKYMDREVAALTGDLQRGKKKEIPWKLKYLYDGDCSMCQSLKTVLERQDRGKGDIKFVNIADPDYKPTSNMGIEYEEAMETIHVIKPDGGVLYGVDALNAMFDVVGLGWAVKLGGLPGVSSVVDKLYSVLSENRLKLGNTFDAVIAAKRVEMSKKGIETCGDMDEECAVEW